jgi:hypothetical protein
MKGENARVVQLEATRAWRLAPKDRAKTKESAIIIKRENRNTGFHNYCLENAHAMVR